MKIDGYDVPENIYYNKEHEWILIEKGGLVKVGITDYAQKMLKEITLIYLPKKGLNVNNMEVFGTVESIKAISELYSPFTGKIVKVNQKLRKKPRIINENPYGEGWIIALRPSRLEEEIGKTIKPKQYSSYIKELIKIDEDLLIYRWKSHLK